MAGVLEDVRAEDFIEYFLFPTNNDFNLALAEINSIVKDFTKDYIWHKDPFFLKAVEPAVNSGLSIPHLHGVTHFGDNIEDEWFIVALILNLTARIPGLIARVEDSDGEFLLIEAADFLPKWASPDSCEKRVYIFDGSIHLVSENDNKSQDVSVESCLQIVRKQSKLTKASEGIQNAIQMRTKGYPEKANKSLHYTNVYVPATVATLLEVKPQLVAPATIAFCDRDMIDSKACRAMRFFPPETRVLTRVAFTRCLYAALVRQRFTPDRRTGWSLPPFNSSEFAAHELGAKLASGFEILVARAKPRPGEDSRAWQLYVDKLKSRGYFQGLLEGSKDHTVKLQEAKQYFSEYGAEAGEAVGESILGLLSNMDVDVEKFKAKEANLPKPDSDSWLEITPEELDEMLKERYGTERSNFPAGSHPSQIPSQLNKFLEQMSGLEGVEFPGKNGDDDPPVRPKRGVKKGKNKSSAMDISDSEQTDSPAHAPPKVDFNPDAFACAVQNILDFALPDDNWDLESSSDMSSIGEEQDGEVDESNMGKVDEKIKKYMEQMDAELAKTTIGESFEKKKPEQAPEDSFDDIEDFRPVDIDLNALKNVLASYQSELGVGPGPASSLLGPMGVHLETMPTSRDKAGHSK